MKILERLFKRDTTMHATAERTESELRTRLAEVQAEIAGGEGDVLSLLGEREVIQRAIEAARIVREKADSDAYRAKIEDRRDAYLRELNAELVTLWRVMPELRWALFGLRQLEERMEELGRGSWEESTGLPVGAVGRMSAAITEALAGTRLGQEAFTPGEVTAPIVGPIREPTVAIHVRPGTDVNGNRIGATRYV